MAISFFINHLKINLNKLFNIWLIILLVVCFDLFIQKLTLTNILGFEALPQGSNIYRLGGFMDQELKIANFIFHFGLLIFAYFFSKKFLKN